jgi:hypothetical protein
MSDQATRLSRCGDGGEITYLVDAAMKPSAGRQTAAALHAR